VIGVARKTPQQIRLGICIYKTSLLHRSDDYIGFTPSCPPSFYNKIAPMGSRANYQWWGALVCIDHFQVFCKEYSHPWNANAG